MRKNPISKLEVEKVEYLIEDIQKGNLILSHTLQRYSGQWSREQKGNLIRRILHDGQFLPILICTQYDENGCEVKYLIDGVQRISTIDEYLRDEFEISKATIDYMVSYDGIVYEQKVMKNGKFCLRKDKNGKLFPVLDEEGKKQRKVQTIDIRGLKYSDLPPELQEKIKRYLVSVQWKLECSDEDIQLEILDYNSGTKMNDAQIGKNCLGTQLAKHIIDLSNHSFFVNKCGFSENDRVKGFVDRAINEALMLTCFGSENWEKNHKVLCKKLANWLTAENIEELREIFESLDEIIPEDKEISDYLKPKEFFIVMANYKHFCESGYKKECYGMFFNDFVKVISEKPIVETGEIDDDGNEIYATYRTAYRNTKDKGAVSDRLEQMNKMLDEYLAENCSDMLKDDDDVEDTEYSESINTENNNDSLEICDELEEFSQNFVTNEATLKTLMLSTDGHPFNNFDKETLKQMNLWFKENGNKQMLDDCLFYKSFVTDNGIQEDDKNLPLFVFGIKYIFTNELDVDIDEWLTSYKDMAFDGINCKDENSNAAIAQKQSEIIHNITTF